LAGKQCSTPAIKQKNSCEWREIIRIANTQKVVYNNAKNKLNEIIEVKTCSEPSHKLKEIYQILKLKNQLFRIKSVVHKLEIKNHQCSINKGSSGCFDANWVKLMIQF
jgi:recombinational DNA repair protein RecT